MLSCFCLSCLMLAACSGSPERPDRGAKDDAGSTRPNDEANNATAVAGEGDIVIEKAFLRRGDGGDEIVARGRLGSAPDASCILRATMFKSGHPAAYHSSPPT